MPGVGPQRPRPPHRAPDDEEATLLLARLCAGRGRSERDAGHTTEARDWLRDAGDLLEDSLALADPSAEIEAEMHAILRARAQVFADLADGPSARSVLDSLREGGLDPTPHLTSGQLVTLTAGEAYLRGGAFDPDGMISLLREETEQALAAGVVTKLGRFLRIVTSDVVHVEGEPGGGMLVGINAPRIVLPPHSVLLSGTLLPDIKDVLGVGAVVTVPRPKLKVYVTPWLTSRYGEFEENIEGYVSLLKALRLRFRRVLGFGSGRIIRVLSKRLNALVEGEITRIPSSWDGILLLKSRGRFSEGVDIPADAVVMIGAPYLTPDVIQRLANVYRRLGYERYWEMAGDVPMLVTTLQCIGRATRVPSARPTVILADHRFLRHRESLSSYLEMEELGGLEQVKPG